VFVQEKDIMEVVAHLMNKFFFIFNFKCYGNKCEAGMCIGLKLGNSLFIERKMKLVIQLFQYNAIKVFTVHSKKKNVKYKLELVKVVKI
jgi:hypothetical protein